MPTNYLGEYRPHPPKVGHAKRLAVYIRDEWMCQYCGRAFVPGAANLTGRYAPYNRFPGESDDSYLEIDHILPRKHGGTNDINNLRAACTPCNKRKSAWLREGQWALRFRLAKELLETREPTKESAERVISELIGRPFSMKELKDA